VIVNRLNLNLLIECGQWVKDSPFISLQNGGNREDLKWRGS
jgi:hypothetical protein